MFRTPVCDLLGIEHPIVNAPMNPEAGIELASAVSEAGGLGMFWISRGMTDDIAQARVRAARERTDGPIGGGMVAAVRNPADAAAIERVIRVSLDAGLPVLGVSFADPTPYVRLAHAAGATILAQVQTVAGAKVAAEAGADVIVAQGTDAGGHTGGTGTLSLVPAIVDAVGQVPVIAAGGIADGRGLAAALMLGAQGAWVGSAFLLSEEAATPQFIRERIGRAGTDDTVLTKVFDIVRELSFAVDIRGRGILNEFIRTWQHREGEVSTRRFELLEQVNAAYAAGDAENYHVWVSSAVGLIERSEPAGDIVRRLCADADRVLQSRVSAFVR